MSDKTGDVDYFLSQSGLDSEREKEIGQHIGYRYDVNLVPDYERLTPFLARYIDDAPGPLVDTDGTVLGEHRGLAFYTLGQRQGLGVGGLPDRPEAPWYVVAKDVRRNSLVISQCEADLTTRTLRASQLNWIAAPRNGRCAAKVRYRQPDQACEIVLHGDCAEIVFDAPQRAVTPGQHVAFYDGDECLGGGRIEATW